MRPVTSTSRKSGGFAPSPIPDWMRALAPVTRLKPSEWAQQHRMLPQASAARGARWDNRVAPFLVDIMDACVEPGISSIAVQKSVQTGVSEAMLTVVGYFIEYRPTPMMWVCPTASVATDFSKERLQDMVLSTAQLRRLVSDKRLPSRDERPESTLQLKMFPGGFLALGGANSPNVFARWSVRIAVGDDVDRWPPSVGGADGEGDPGQLLVNRTQSFHDALCVFISTPVSSRGRICTLYEQSDRRRYFVTCSKCGRCDWITWSDPSRFRVAFDERTPSTARIECQCGHRIYEPERRALVASGEWRPTAEPVARGHVGFHVPGMLSPFITLEQLVTKFLTGTREGPTKLKEFITTHLGEGWQDVRDRIDPADLQARARASAF